MKMPDESTKIPKAVIATLIIVGGLGVGMFTGGFVSFGACTVDNCTSMERNATFLYPIFSLFITVPSLYFIFKDSSL